MLYTNNLNKFIVHFVCFKNPNKSLNVWKIVGVISTRDIQTKYVLNKMIHVIILNVSHAIIKVNVYLVSTRDKEEIQMLLIVHANKICRNLFANAR